MSKRGETVPRPKKNNEYEIKFASREAEKGWRDLCATHRNAMADCWDLLTSKPTEPRPTNYPLKGELGTVTYQGTGYTRWQYKPTAGGSGRVWFFVDEKTKTVYLEDVHTTHPTQTK
jgi:mRNA-degrading endonuclease RelE of RelBE toxin-antitoxin system